MRSVSNPHAVVSAIAALVAVLLPRVGTAQDAQKRTIPDDTEIQTTTSGLKYSVLKPGTSETKPQPGDKVFVQYTGWLTDGTEFDSSRKPGREPFSFVIGGGVIAGWNEGVQLMTEGSRVKFTIPSDLGYGPGGSGTIPPDSTLIFDVELLSIISMPKFKPANPDAQKTTESGLKYETLKAGEGELFKKEGIFKLAYAIFEANGRLLECSEQTGTELTGKIEDMAVPFLKEAPMLMQRGSRFRFEVPQSLGLPNLPGTTVWELELIEIMKPLPLPEFSMSAEDSTETTASGLKYEIIKAGEGQSPTATSTVTVHYAGWLTDGTLFDSSYGRGDTTSFPLNRVIPGWTEGIQLMKLGGVYKFTIPGDLAYGSRGSPPNIGPDATLVFHVELLKIN